MPDEPRRIVLEKSKTVRRRYQRSNQRFKFSASQIERLDREEEREKKAKQLREKDKKRAAAKKRKAEQEARVREERKRRGIPDPNAPRVPSSQPLLSMFLGAGKTTPAPATEPEPEPEPEPAPALEPASASASESEPAHTTTETEAHGSEEGSGPGSEAGDTEAGSDAFDDLDETVERDLFELIDGFANPTEPTVDRENHTATNDDGDEFSDCSAFEDIIHQADATATRITDEEKNEPALPEPPRRPLPSQRPNAVPALPVESSFGDSFQFDAADFLEAEAAILKTPIETRPRSPLHRTPLPQPKLEQPRSMPALPSFANSSFRDETADWMEEAFAFDGGDPFDEPHKIPLQ
ncbi:hypothetical protein N7541_010113 [Penicillium brevicompactum]|uniref:Uncharacterized protein n=1 Tax=Penicillium brevicompactum TaxID=5074 RepID=A0A9W9QQB7_PENBR|nr:hypothetical protein N7541_010113 [Penicillium brevicompactum]